MKRENIVDRVFISYAAEDRHIVEKLSSLLSAKGLEVFSDLGLQPGDNIAKSILGAIQSSDYFIPVISGHSAKGEYSNFEYLVALTARASNTATIIPVFINKSDIVEPIFRYFQGVDLAPDFDISRVADEIFRAIQTKKVSNDESRSPDSLKEIRKLAEVDSRLARRIVEEAESYAAAERAFRLRSSLAIGFLSALVSIVLLGISITYLGTTASATESVRDVMLDLLKVMAGALIGVLASISFPLLSKRSGVKKPGGIEDE